MNASELKLEAAQNLKSFLETGLTGYFVQAWDRLHAAGLDVDLRREASQANARALLWLAENR